MAKPQTSPKLAVLQFSEYTYKHRYLMPITCRYANRMWQYL